MLMPASLGRALEVLAAISANSESNVQRCCSSSRSNGLYTPTVRPPPIPRERRRRNTGSPGKIILRSISYRQDNSCPNYSKLLPIVGQRYIFPPCKINVRADFYLRPPCATFLSTVAPPPPPPLSFRSRGASLPLSRYHRNRYANGGTTYLALQPRNIHQCPLLLLLANTGSLGVDASAINIKAARRIVALIHPTIRTRRCI